MNSCFLGELCRRARPRFLECLVEPESLADRDALYGALFAHTAVELDDPVANLKYRYTVREDGWKLILPYLPNSDTPEKWL